MRHVYEDRQYLATEKCVHERTKVRHTNTHTYHIQRGAHAQHIEEYISTSSRHRLTTVKRLIYELSRAINNVSPLSR
jgi:hypothetical protein